MAASSSLVPDRLRLPLCFLGVFVCYFYYGILQEKITRGKYGEGANQETFTFALTLVFIQCVINAVFAKILIQFFDTARVDRTRSWLYAACSVSYLGAMVSSNSALQFVNYPTQVLGKSCKPIPVMLLGVTLLRKKYPLAKYLCVLLIVAGVALFMYKPKKVVGMEEHTIGYGELLLLLSLTLDGLTGVSQDHMRAHYQTGSNHMMLNINLWSTLLLGAELHFHDSCIFWSPDLLHHHHNSKVLHHLGLCDPLRQPHQSHAVGGHCVGIPGSWSRCQVWEGNQEDIPLRRGTLPPLQKYLTYYLKSDISWENGLNRNKGLGSSLF
ncbi:solute carrier family 35 member B1 isoform X1 [Loxodonta africana]|uniref:solute carrier family 35 member B1 isoform X1 n=1 Tax=Loxodonta africana TaxID=9785 RepID=UPI0030CDE742